MFTFHQIEAKMENEETMTELLEYLQETYFIPIDRHSQLFRQGQVTEAPQIHNTIEELTGIFMELRTFQAVALTCKVNRELSYYHSEKISIENSGGKFISSLAEKEASKGVSNERRILNIIEAKLEACEQGISVCQSKMKLLASEPIL